MNNVRTIREAKGLTQRELAKLAGTSQQQIDRLEKGQSPFLELAWKVALALESGLEELFPEEMKRSGSNA
jgi:transcriptional regulator with XRE-family HTH domain